MDAVMTKKQSNCDGGSFFGGAAAGARSRVWFGGTYQEHWSDDYRLLVSYSGRSKVDCAFAGRRWQPAGGDTALCERLLREQDEPFLQRYFQAAAQAYFSAQNCLERGLPLSALYECYPCGADPLCAAELLRLCLDDCGMRLEDALPLAWRCCPDYAVTEEELAALVPLQPRTAALARLLRDNEQQIPAVLHDARLADYRRPFGAVRCGEALSLRLRVLSGRVDRAAVLFYGDSMHREEAMRREGDWFSYDASAPDEPAALWYAFRLETAQGERWLCPEGRGTGARLCETPSGAFRLTVFQRDFDTPAWFRKSVMYQAFPDRFAFSDDDTAQRGIEYHRALGQTPELHRDRSEAVRWQPRPFERDYSPDDFYGGTLKGIEAKLPYLQKLGAGCLYLNPIFEARSNHRYDTSDYLKVDPILGSNEDFERLCRTAESYGIRIMLDGVFSHTGADSVYFNRYGHYPSLGACQGESSPYYSWYDFRRFPDEYRCWWGFQDLPEVEETRPDWQDFVVTGHDSVVRQWLRRGAAGWRLDVADELPDEVLALIRRAAKEEKPDAPILGEVWEDAILKEGGAGRRRYALGDALDSVMNYPFRQAMLDFIHKRIDAYALRDFLTEQQLSYPQPMYYALMNLLGSHDVDRIRTAMAAPITLRHLSRPEQLNYPFREEDLACAVAREKLCAALQFAIPGVPSIYYGDEQGMWGTGDPFNRAPFMEDDRELFDYYVNLSARRKANDCLQTGAARFDACHADVLSVLRYVNHSCDVFGTPAQNGAWLLVLNRSDEARRFEADAREAGGGWITGTIDGCSAQWIKIK